MKITAKDLVDNLLSEEGGVASPAVYTPKRIKDAARDHIAYGWSKKYHQNADGSPWTDEQRKIYDDEYAAARRAATVERFRRDRNTGT